MSDDAIARLLAVSARIGADPALVQGAGGNVSIKQDGVLWVKASGKWLAKAGQKPMLVPLDLGRVREQLKGATEDQQPVAGAVVLQSPPIDLRPSIEATLHAIMPHPVVFHVHCTRTLAWSVQQGAQDALQQRLEGLDWAWIPYARPGLPLTREMEARITQGPSVVVLGNHGLVVGADTPEAAEALLADVARRLETPSRTTEQPKLDFLASLAAKGGYRLPRHPEVHSLALNPANRAHAAQGSLYPDHVVFLGHAVTVLEADETPAQASRRVGEQEWLEPALVLVPDAGVLVRDDVSANGEEMALSLALVVGRIPPDSSLNVLSRPQELELVNWDAEKYRRSLNA